MSQTVKKKEYDTNTASNAYSERGWREGYGCYKSEGVMFNPIKAGLAPFARRNPNNKRNTTTFF